MPKNFRKIVKKIIENTDKYLWNYGEILFNKYVTIIYSQEPNFLSKDSQGRISG